MATIQHFTDGSKTYEFADEQEEACYHLSTLFWRLADEWHRRQRLKKSGELPVPAEYEQEIQRLFKGLN